MVSTTTSGRGDSQAIPATDRNLTIAIIEAVAAAKNTAPTAIDVQLSNYVDLDALNDLYSHSSGNETATWKVEFTVDGVAVTVHSDGRVTTA